jgi:hypothetical protein
VESSSSSGGGWPGAEADGEWPPHGSGDPTRTHGWPSVDGGIEVSIEVRSNILELEGERSACRLLMVIGCLSVIDLLSPLCHSTVGTSLGSCTPCCCPCSGAN